jgi:hypothetical protein
MHVPPSKRLHQVTRRNFFEVGGAGLLGLTLPQLLAAQAAPAHGGKAKNCIVLFLEGGPSHIDLWDLKPEADVTVRGDFQPIGTTVPGVQVCDQLPLFAQQMHHLAQIRSVHHKINDHNAGAYYMLTGRSPVKSAGLIIKDEPENFPPFGAVLATLRPHKTLPPFVHLPDMMSNNGFDLPGQRAGFLSPAADPLLAGDPSVKNYQVPGLGLPKGMTPDRLAERNSLYNQLASGPDSPRLSTFREQAFSLLTSSDARQAFDLSRESAKTRERYGLPDREDRRVEARKFGGLPHLGQCCLLARRLIESGVRLVTVASGRRIDQAWDTHRDHFPLLKKSLCPYFDRAAAALLADLHERGLLEETLVVIMGEFGRTPRIGQVTSSAGADKGGRDHWTHCYTVLLAGGGIQGGAVYGQSDAIGAYPKDNPVTPEDVAATIYHALGFSPETRIHDAANRPHSIALGEPIEALF